MALYPRDKIIEVYLGIMRYIKANEGEFVYGFLFSMASDKFPGMFIAGIGNDNLSARDEEYLDAWVEGKDKCDSRIWTVFWGNLVTNKHFKKPENMNKLRMTVGESNFFEVDGSAFFFKVPGVSLVLEDEEKRTRRELLALFDPLVRS